MAGRKIMANVGDKIEIIREKNKTIKFYPSQILDIIEENIFIISGPIYKNKIILLTNLMSQHRGEGNLSSFL